MIFTNAQSGEQIVIDIKKIVCKECNGRNFTREGGIEIHSHYKDGKCVGTTRVLVDTRLFCDNCQKEFLWYIPCGGIK